MIKIVLNNKDTVIKKHRTTYYMTCKEKLKNALAIYRHFNRQFEAGQDPTSISELSSFIGTDNTKVDSFLKKIKDSHLENSTVHAESIKVLYILKGNLDSVLVGEYIQLDKIIVLTKKHLEIFLELKDKRKTYQDLMKPFIAILENIFDYDDFIQKKTKDETWCGYRLAENYNVNVCPYCNRSYTNTVINDQEFIIRPQFDHFYKKEKYPFLSISLFNLIPSCSICNSVLKRRLEFSTTENIYPLNEGFENDYLFSTGKSLSDFLDSNIKLDQPIKLVPHPKFDNPLKEIRILNNSVAFRLVDIYDKHRDIAEEILFKGRYLKEVDSELLKRISDKLASENTEMEFYKFIVGNYDEPENFHLRPLSKFMRDIAYEAEIVSIELPTQSTT